MMVGGFILVISLISLIASASMSYKTLRVRSWPKATAKVRDKEIVRTDKPTGTARTLHYEVRLTYLFSVDGKVYTGTKVRPTEEVTTMARAQKLIEGLGEEVSVYYNPANPEEAYLKTNSLFWSIVAFVFAILGTLIGAGMLLGGGKSGS